MFTILLVAINVVIFMTMMNSPATFDATLNQYGLNNQTMSYPVVWLTSMFLHANTMHIVMNMIALLQVGFLTEKDISSKGMIFVYFLSGFAGTIASVMYIGQTSELITVIGASGAIFGLFAFYSILSGGLKSFITQAVIFHGVIFALNLPVAWYAHAGGIAMGAFLSLFYLSSRDS
jgi:membrane associated rhomboid family serine protease